LTAGRVNLADQCSVQRSQYLGIWDDCERLHLQVDERNYSAANVWPRSWCCEGGLIQFDAITSTGIPIPNRNILMDQYFKGVFMRAGTARIAEAEVIATVLIESGLAKKPVLVEPNSDPQFLSVLIGSKP
jgi:hypothetical protein